MSGANRNLSIWSLMTTEENGQNRHKKMSRFRKVSIALALLVGTLFTVAFVVQWDNAQKMEKEVSNEFSQLHAENMALNDSIATKIEKMNNETWEEISNLRVEVEKNASLALNETGKMMAKAVTAFSANVEFLYKLLELHHNVYSTQMGTMMGQWLNNSKELNVMHRNISKFLVERLDKLEENQNCMVLSALTICPFKMNSTNRWDAKNCGEDATISQDGMTVVKGKEVHYQTNVRAEQPFTFNFSSAQSNDGNKCCARHFYFEVLVKKMDSNRKGVHIGLVGPSFAANESSHFVYDLSSYGIDGYGNFIEGGGRFTQPHIPLEQDGFNEGDTVGCGLLRLPHGQIKLFYTKNGQLYGKTTLVDTSTMRTKPVLYPVITMDDKGTTVEANFGTDPGKPYKFNITEHNALLEG